MTLQRTLLAASAALLAAAGALFAHAANAQSLVLSVLRAGTGNPIVQSSTFSISCPSTCSANYNTGDTVTLNALVFAPAYLVSWTGCDTASGNQCTVTMNADRTVTLTTSNPVTSNEPVQQQVRSSDGFTCALSTAGGVRCLGRNTNGQLGNNDPAHATQGTWVDVVGLTSSVVDLAVGEDHACAVLATGGLKCWGRNASGQLGDGTTTGRDTPVDVLGIANAVQVTAGITHTCVLTSPGNVKCWGSGPIGDNTTNQRLTPTDVVNLPEIVTEVRAGFGFNCALTAAGAMKCWGTNFDGELGDNSTTTRNAPVPVSAISGVASFATGVSHTCAVTTAGAAFCWGLNQHGQLGDGSNTSRSVPTAVTGLGSGVSSMAGGGNHTCAVLATGDVKCWGFNNNRELGDGTFTARNAPVDVVALGGGAGLSLGYNHSCALLAAGRVACWGFWYNPNATTVNLQQATLIRSLGGIVQLSAGFNNACVATTTGVRCAGVNVGDGTSNQRTRFVDVQQLNTGTLAVAAGTFVDCAITNAGGVVCWGDSGLSLLGSPEASAIGFSNLPVPATGLSSGVTGISTLHNHVCAIQGGVVKCWGQNDKGQLGLGFTGSPVDTPTAIAFVGGFDQLAAGRRSTCALRSGGVLCWGDNDFGQIGIGSFSSEVLTPTAPTGLATGVVSVVAGDQFYCALKNDGSVQCWGSNQKAQLGRGTANTIEPTPAVVTGLTSGVAEITAYGTHACARLATGGVKCWGENTSGEIGDGTTSPNRNVPTDVLNLGSDVQQVSAGVAHTCVLTWSGKVRCWGGNLAGSFGTGDSANSLSPTPGAIGQSLAFSLPTSVTAGASTPLAATATSGLAASFATNTVNCTVSGTSFTLDSGGRCGIAATQSGDANWFAAPTRRAVATAAGLSVQAVAFGNLLSRFTVEAPFVVSATGGGSGNPVTFSSLTTSICTTGGTNGATVTLTGTVGTCTLQASQAGNASFLSGQATASFTVQSFSVNVTVTKGGTGAGTVTGGGIDCGATCVTAVTGGSFVLTATPGLNSVFTGWSGCNSVSGTSCTVTISGFSNRFINANFAITNVAQTITLTPDPLPDQTLQNFQYFFSTSASSGLLVSVAVTTPATCAVQGNTVANKLIVLLAIGPCTVVATQAGNATFAPAPPVTRTFQVLPTQYSLTVDKSGAGTGTITGAGINCGASCNASIAQGSVITLTATANPGSQFVGWQNCPEQPAGNICAFTAIQGVFIVAQFEPAPPAGPFQPGNLVVYRIGDGVSALASTGNAVFLDEYRPNGTLRQTIALPSTASGSQRALNASGTATTDGMLTRSDSRNCLVLPGYGRDLGTGSGDIDTGTAAGGALVPRVIGVVSADGDVDTTTALTDAALASSFRSAASSDCNQLYGSGAPGSGGGGVRASTIGATTSTDLTGATLGDTRGVAVVGGQLYVSGSVSALYGVASVGSGIPVTGPQAVASLPGVDNSNAPNTHGFFFVDQDGSPGVDTLYIADEDQGVNKFSLIGGTWVFNGTLGSGTDRYRGLTGIFENGFVTLFATRNANSGGASPGGELVKLTDFCGYGGPPCGSVARIAAAPDNTVFRGVALAPEVIVTPSASPNASISPDSPFVVAGGDTPSFDVAVDAGFNLVMGGTCGGTLTGSTYTINAALINCTVTVTAALPTFTVTPSADANSSITPATPQQSAPNAQLAFTVAASAGYSLAVGGTCGGTLTGTTYTTNAVTQDCTVIVSSSPITHTVTSSAGTNGSITPLGPQVVAYNQAATFTVTPDAGFTAAVGGTCGGTLAGLSYTTATVTADCTVVASFTAAPPDTTPDAFAFNDVTSVGAGSVVTSNAITVAGITAPSPISVTGGSYSIGCTATFTAAAGTIANGETVCVRHTAPLALSAVTDTVLTIGGVSDTFSSTTLAALSPDADQDNDGIPNSVEAAEGRNPFVKDNDIFANPRLFAMQQYRDFLGREGDAGGIQFYIDLLNSGTVAREQVIESFLASPEFANGLPPVIRLYSAFFNRIPDYGGLIFQASVLRSGTPLELIAQNFYNAPEFTNTYGALSNDDYINLVYQNVLGRAPDPGGFAFYKNLLDNNTITKGQMMIGFSESPEFRQLSDNESWVVSVYVGLLRRTPEAAGLDFYVNLLDNGLSRANVVPGFYNSLEYHNRFLP